MSGPTRSRLRSIGSTSFSRWSSTSGIRSTNVMAAVTSAGDRASANRSSDGASLRSDGSQAASEVSTRSSTPVAPSTVRLASRVTSSAVPSTA